MAINKYITLQDSTASRTKNYVVTFPGYNPILDPHETIDTTLDGELDVQRGSLQEVINLTLRVAIEEDDPDFGNQDDLKYFYKLRNPKGSPSDKITYTNHYGQQYIVVMTGQYNPNIQTVYLEGPYAFALIPVTLRVVSIVAEGS